MVKPEVLIERIRESFDESRLVYTQGSCYRFFLILRTVYPDAEAYYDWVEGHVYTKIDGKFYDIRGRCANAPKDLERLNDTHLAKTAHRWKYGKGSVV